MHWMVDHYPVSVRRACGYGLFSRAAWYRKSRAPDPAALRRRIREIAHLRPRFGYLRIHVMLRREGWRINRKRGHRLYRIVEPRFLFRGSDVADLLDRWVAAHGVPETITVDHGTEFTSKALETWAWKHGVSITITADLTDPWGIFHPPNSWDGITKTGP